MKTSTRAVVHTAASNLKAGDYLFCPPKEELGSPQDYLLVTRVDGVHILKVTMVFGEGFKVEEFLKTEFVFIKQAEPQRMRDEYGTPVTMMLQKEAVYRVPNHGQMPKHFAEQVFYKWQLINEKNVNCLSLLQFDVIKAAEFAKNNGLTIVKEHPMDSATERKSAWAWPDKNQSESE